MTLFLADLITVVHDILLLEGLLSGDCYIMTFLAYQKHLQFLYCTMLLFNLDYKTTCNKCHRFKAY